MTTANTTSSIHDVSLKTLREEFIRQRDIQKAGRQCCEAIIDEVRRRHSKNMCLTLLTDKGKTHGEATDIIDDCKLTVYLPQKVEWDTEKLMKIYASMDAEIAQKVFKVSLSVPEKIFGAITDPELNKKLTDARMVKIGEPMIDFVLDKKS